MMMMVVMVVVVVVTMMMMIFTLAGLQRMCHQEGAPMYTDFLYFMYVLRQALRGSQAFLLTFSILCREWKKRNRNYGCWLPFAGRLLSYADYLLPDGFRTQYGAQILGCSVLTYPVLV